MVSILGISAFYHDSAASLLVDGEIIAAAQEERFTRKKHDSDFPKNAISYVLDEGKININNIDHIVFYEKPFLKFERLLETYVALAPKGYNQFRIAMPEWLKNKLFLKNLIATKLVEMKFKKKDFKILFNEHHMSHAASAFFPSNFERAAILTTDAVGEWATTTIAIGEGNNLEIIEEQKFPHSLGLLYSAFTYYLGFKVNSGEYKVMGLAPYGEPRFHEMILKNLIDLKEDGSFKIDQSYFNYSTGLTMISNKFIKLFGKPNRKSESDELTQFHMDIAASIQSVTEEIMLRIARYISHKFKIENLCLAGGVALNCVANGKILKEGIFQNIWVQPAAGDAGGALGACLSVWYQKLKNERVVSDEKSYDFMKGSYLGPYYSDKEIENTLNGCGAKYNKLDDDDLFKYTANCLSEGLAIGWFQGRMEFGPRALGNRSIIADPRSEKMQKILNLKVKFRESFRPFAPAILSDDLEDWFNLKKPSPYMLFVENIREEIKVHNEENKKDYFGIDLLNLKRSSIPAVTHVDYSARIQTVHKATNLRFHSLLKEFKRKTGVPILVNTSFNVRGEPIVNSPLDAYQCFIGTGLDILVIGNFVINKSDQNLVQNYNHQARFKLD